MDKRSPKGKSKKGKKKGNKKPKSAKSNVLKEVDKTFYELQIVDLNRKLARLRDNHEEVSTLNEQLQKKLEDNDKDTKDIVSYLDRTIATKERDIQILGMLNDNFCSIEGTCRHLRCFCSLKMENEKKN